LTQNTQTFTIVDPSTFDGDPFEVAKKAVDQASAVAAKLWHAIDAGYNMVINAEMERQIQATGAPDASEADGAPVAVRYTTLLDAVAEVETALRRISVAASYNPKKPPKE
jgi:hypothetical protein